MTREERVKCAAECLCENEVFRFNFIYSHLKKPLEWTLFYDLDEKWVSLEYDPLDLKIYFGSENR